MVSWKIVFIVALTLVLNRFFVEAYQAFAELWNLVVSLPSMEPWERVQFLLRANVAQAAVIDFVKVFVSCVEFLWRPSSVNVVTIENSIVLLVTRIVTQALQRWRLFPKASEKSRVSEMFRTTFDLSTLFLIAAFGLSVAYTIVPVQRHEEIVLIESAPTTVIFLNSNQRSARIRPFNELPLLVAAGFQLGILPTWNDLPNWALREISKNAAAPG